MGPFESVSSVVQFVRQSFQTAKDLLTLVNDAGSGFFMRLRDADANDYLTVDANGNIVSAGNIRLQGITSAGIAHFDASGNLTSSCLDLSSDSLCGTLNNSYLTNNSVTINTGSGLSGGGTVALGASLSLTNTGVLSVNGASGAVSLALSGVSYAGRTSVSAGTTSFAYPVGAATAGGSPDHSKSLVLTAAKSIKNFFVSVDGPAGVGQFTKVSMLKNGLAAGFLLDFNDGSTVLLSDTSTTVSCAAGDLITIQIDTSAATGSTDLSWGFSYE